MRLDKMLGIKYPFIQGGMANIATGEFAAAVSNAGGLGLIGAGGMNTDMLRENIRKCRTLTDKPFGVNLMLMNPEADAMAELLVEENVKIVTTGAGSPAKYMEKWNSNFACRNKMSKFAYLKQNNSEQRCQLLPSRKWLPAAICAIL